MQMMRSSLLLAAALASLAVSQHVNYKAQERHPKLTTWKCTHEFGCTPRKTAIVLDELSRPLYQVSAPTLGCGISGPPNTTVCPDAQTCQANCAMDGISDYSTVGVSTNGSDLYLRQLKDGSLALLTPRVYLLSELENSYEMLNLVGQEFSFDVDVSKLPCGMNGALYFSEMEQDGGKSSLNTAGPAYGTGYCDAQCHVPAFIDGEGNIDGDGACCNELDIWEANSRATQFTPHTCNITGNYHCQGAECSKNGVCDQPGCGYNTYAVGNKNYYGSNMVVDTNRPFTVVTQFPADDAGNLLSIKRLYVQDGNVIDNVAANKTSLPHQNYINDKYCEAAKSSAFLSHGGMHAMGASMNRGMVLAMSIWWDQSGGNMGWLDAGGSGPCTATEGSPAWIQQTEPDTAVRFGNIKWGDIGATYKAKA